MAFVVTNTQDSGPGSLRQAILDANNNPGPNSISFNIPPSDPNYVGYQDDGAVGMYDPNMPIIPVGSGHDPDGPLWWRIVLASQLPAMTRDGTLLDGSSQRFNHLDSNPYGPEVEVVAGNLALLCNQGIVREVIVNSFASGANIALDGNENHLLGSYVGLEPGGAANTANSGSGDIAISISGDNNQVGGLTPVERNLISSANLNNLLVEGNNNQIIGNYIGINREATATTGTSSEAVTIWGGIGNLIANNVIGAGSISSIDTFSAIQTTIRSNYIGTDPSGQFDLGDPNSVAIILVTSNNIVGPGNVIKKHGTGLVINSEMAVGNTVTRNAISDNAVVGIRLVNGGNGNIQAPIITFAGPYIAGTAPPQAIIEVFSDNGSQGAIYEGVTQADHLGNFAWYGSPQGPNITATATDVNGNTSEFSLPYPAFALWLPFIRK
jgi:hypothetical protein